MEALNRVRGWRIALACTLACALALGFGVAAGAPSSAATAADDSIASATNSYRSANGKAALARHTGIDAVAQDWAEWMRSNRTLKHNSNYSSQMPQAGLSRAGENVAYACGRGSATANATVIMNGWKNSSGHRANMLNSAYTDFGVGAAYDSSRDCLWAVQNFGTYTSATSAKSGTQFWDVPKSHQFYDEIEWLAGTGITTGYSDGSFRPDAKVTREAFAAFMYRLDGRPSYSAPKSSAFTDVSPSDPFYKEISWLASTGISTGWSDGTFRPKDNISREAMAAFLYRYYEQPSTKVNAAQRFKDLGWGDRFLREISWLANEGISTGYSDGTFRPHSSVTREAMAAFLERASDN
ncbi:S-layer homology domain-containing protein [uncultured Demequina sp.]|uniref:CAP and S-layer homology domain-containing protein n=1 Tax=uncultured Demequina sp. TaxID=693499 RepID=UPI0025D85568|nr:S-layer homology domain-containing protein [uncultured Demequina sp.]